MAAPERTVRHLRLRAPDEAAARRIMPTLEDALRCASLGDEGSRLIVVRQLALGRVTAGMSPQTLSRLIETKAAAVTRQWVAMPEGGDTEAAADQAGCVVFAGVLEARMQLASRLLRGQRVDAWYWPLAVPEFDVRLPVRINVARIAVAIARTREAHAALPRWVAALVRSAGAARVIACIDEADGERLLHIAGLSSSPSPPRPPVGGARRPGGKASDRSGLAGATAATRLSVVAIPAGLGAARGPRWLHRLLGMDDFVPAVHAEKEAPRVSGIDAEVEAGARVAASTSTRMHPIHASPVPAAESVPSRGVSADRSDPEPPSMASDLTRSDSIDVDAPGPRAPAARDALADLRSSPADAWPWLQPTTCGGLLFLLPVLARLGLAQHMAGEPAARRFTAEVLHLALRRAHAPLDDPMWELAATFGLDGLGIAPAAASTTAQSLETAAAAALSDARRWLHGAGRIGLVRLVRRPARLSVTATHVDLHFALEACDLRLRRIGLDLDPGWLPWFGRVVAFHYGSAS